MPPKPPTEALTVLEPVVVTPLSKMEVKQLEHFEEQIRQNMRGFLIVGRSLLEINKLRLYRETHDSFEAYLEDKWDLSERHGYRLVQAAEVVQNLEVMAGEFPMPISEYQVRELAELPPTLQAEVWKEACQRAGEGKVPPARVVSEVVETRVPADPDAKPKKKSTAKPTVDEELDDEVDGDEDEDGPSRDELFTPPDYAKAVRDVLGDIELDPASCAEANANIGAKGFYTLDDDGLKQDWTAETVYLNPPYSRGNVDRFVKKFVEAYEAGEFSAGILLVNAATGTSWFQPLFEYPCCFVQGRIPFVKSQALAEHLEKKAQETGGTVPKNGNYDSVFVYVGPRPWDFVERFKRLGTIVRKLDVMACGEDT